MHRITRCMLALSACHALLPPKLACTGALLSASLCGSNIDHCSRGLFVPACQLPQA